MAWPLTPLLAVTAASHLTGRRRKAYCEDAALPSWLKESVAKDPSRKEKIQSYEDAQVSAAALQRNAALPPKGESTRLVSYNLHFHCDSQFKPNLTRVLDVLKTLDADVVALQEAALPPTLEKKGGRPSEKEEPNMSQTTDSIEGLTRQMFQDTQQEVVGYSAAPHQGIELLEGLRQLGYTHCIYSPGFYSGAAKCHCGNVVASRHALEGEVVIMDRNRFHEERSAAVATIKTSQDPLTVVSTHLDVWAEMRGFFGMAEGEAIRLLEFEALHHALRQDGAGAKPCHIAIMGDFNTASQSAVVCSEEHQRFADLLDRLTVQRDPKALRHFLPRSSPRLPQEMTALGFAEKLGYRHAWQELQRPSPFYSHWSGQLIDHCLLKSTSSRKPRVVFVGVYHTSASDHLPLVVDLEF